MRRKELAALKTSLADYNAVLEQEKLLGLKSYKDIQSEDANKEEKKPVFNLKGAATINYGAAKMS